MKVVVTSNELKQAVNKVVKACATKSTQEILECIEIVAIEDCIILSATDLEMCIETQIRAEVLEKGEVLINGKMLYEYVNKIDNGEDVSITSQDKEATIKCGKLRFTIPTLNHNDYPIIAKDCKANHFTISVSELKRLVSQTLFCVANDDARPILKGVLWETKGNELVATSLDGFRLARATASITELEGNVKCVVPARSLKEMVSIINAETETITVYMQNSGLMCETEDTFFITRLLNGDFMNCDSILASPTQTTVIVEREELLSALERLSIVAKMNNNIVRIDLATNQMSLQSTTNVGEMQEDMEVYCDCSQMAIHINCKYLVDFLKAINDETVAIQLKDGMSPIFIRRETYDNMWEFLMLPVRVSK